MTKRMIGIYGLDGLVRSIYCFIWAMAEWPNIKGVEAICGLSPAIVIIMICVSMIDIRWWHVMSLQLWLYVCCIKMRFDGQKQRVAIILTLHRLERCQYHKIVVLVVPWEALLVRTQHWSAQKGIVWPVQVPKRRYIRCISDVSSYFYDVSSIYLDVSSDISDVSPMYLPFPWLFWNVSAMYLQCKWSNFQCIFNVSPMYLWWNYTLKTTLKIHWRYIEDTLTLLWRYITEKMHNMGDFPL